MRLFRNELKRALHGKGMRISVIAVFICIAYKNIMYYINLSGYNKKTHSSETVYELLNRQTFYSEWIVGNIFSPATMYIFYFLGLIAALPFGVSYYLDKKNGLIKNICIRSGKKKYLTAKYFAVFVSGGTAASLPVILDWLMVKLWIPYDFVYIPYTILSTKTEWGVFIVDHIYLSAVIIIFLWFLFGGVLATVSLAISVIADDFFTIQLAPFFFMLVLIYIPNFISGSFNQYLPFYFLSIFGDSNPFIALFVSGVLSIFTFAIFIGFEKGKDCL